jgi:ABC-type uncharacterized transport system permease subunit
MKPLLMNVLALIVAGVITWVLRGVAIDAENVIIHEATGKRRGINNMIYGFAEKAGPEVILGLGIAAILVIGFITYRRFSKPANVAVYQ